MKDFYEKINDYIDKGTTPYAVVANSSQILEEKGFQELEMGKKWKLSPGGSYYTQVYGTSLFAFTVGSEIGEAPLFYLAAAHTDHPCLRVKPRAEMCDNEYLKLDAEVYGGAILNTWLDRPLSIGGKVVVKSKDICHPHEYYLDFLRPLLTIPNLAIHMNREVNKGVELNRQTEMLPIIGMLSEKLNKDNFFLDLLAEEINKNKKNNTEASETGANNNPGTESLQTIVKAEDILDFDLYIYNAEKCCRLGMDQEFISGPRLDNLSSCFCLVNGIKMQADRINIIGLFDNEEIGSKSKQGADSKLTELIIERIYAGLGCNTENIRESIFNSMFLSVDVAHAYHPNYGGKSDPNNKVICGKGLAIKLNYSQKYATDTLAVGILQQLCESNDIKYQKYVNRSDIAGGGTIGSIISAHLPVRTIDIGIPILAMHSAREFMGASDALALLQLTEGFFSL